MVLPKYLFNHHFVCILCSVWSSNFTASDCHEEASEWFSKFLKKNVRFLYFNKSKHHRLVENLEGPRYTRHGKRPVQDNAVVSFNCTVLLFLYYILTFFAHCGFCVVSFGCEDGIFSVNDNFENLGNQNFLQPFTTELKFDSCVKCRTPEK